MDGGNSGSGAGEEGAIGSGRATENVLLCYMGGKWAMDGEWWVMCGNTMGERGPPAQPHIVRAALIARTNFGSASR